MSRARLLFVSLLLFLFGAAPSSASQFVHAKDTQIVDASEHPFTIRGVNIGNWLVLEGYMWHFGAGPSSAHEIDALVNELLGPARFQPFWLGYRNGFFMQTDVQRIHKLGFNTLRVPIHYKFFTADGDEGFRILDRVLAEAHAEGLSVILDMQAAPGGQTGKESDDGPGYPWLLSDASAQQKAADTWRRIAQHYRDNPTVIGYDLLNEPLANYAGYDTFNPNVEPLYRRITSAIREVDKNHLIILDGAQGGSNFGVFTKPFDKNLAYSFHTYSATPGDAYLEPYLAFQKQNNVPLLFGEFGEHPAAWESSFARLMEQHNIGWVFWPYKKLGDTSAIVTCPVPQNWQTIVDFAKLPRLDSAIKQRAAARPPQPQIETAFRDLLTNLQSDHCTTNDDLVHALIP